MAFHLHHLMQAALAQESEKGPVLEWRDLLLRML